MIMILGFICAISTTFHLLLFERTDKGNVDASNHGIGHLAGSRNSVSFNNRKVSENDNDKDVDNDVDVPTFNQRPDTLNQGNINNH